MYNICLVTGFMLGSGKHTVEVIVGSDGHAKVTSGIADLALLKTTQVLLLGRQLDMILISIANKMTVIGSLLPSTYSHTQLENLAVRIRKLCP